MNQSYLTEEISTIKSLLQNNTIGIFLGDKLNLDTAAAALALYLSLQEAGKKVQIVSKREPSVEISNLVGIDKLKSSFIGGSSRVVVSLPYNSGEIGKVSYKEEKGRINFYLTAVEGKSISPYETRDINLVWEGAVPNVIIVLGTSSLVHLSEYVNSKGIALKIVNINTDGESFGDVVIVNPSFSSSSEMAGKIIKELGLSINIDIAQNLLDGILYATRNFSEKNTSPFAFEIAGIMMQFGAKRADNRNQGRANLSFQSRQRNKYGSTSRSLQKNIHDNVNKDSYVKPNEGLIDAPSFGPVDNMEETDREDSKKNVPNDWLMPKVFKGSQDVNDLK